METIPILKRTYTTERFHRRRFLEKCRDRYVLFLLRRDWRHTEITARLAADAWLEDVMKAEGVA